jgi:hypothetical protein
LFFEKRADLGGSQVQEVEEFLIVLVMVVFLAELDAGELFEEAAMRTAADALIHRRHRRIQGYVAVHRGPPP